MKTFLSQIEIPWAWALKQGMGDPYRLHQWIWDALPDDPEAQRDFLFRSDITESHLLRILLLSSRKPTATSDIPWRTTEMSSTFLSHGAYRFRLRANPTFRRAADHRRLAIFDEEGIRDWFKRKFKDAGCDIQALETSAPAQGHLPQRRQHTARHTLRRRCLRRHHRP